jgi:hypothetical protein
MALRLSHARSSREGACIRITPLQRTTGAGILVSEGPWLAPLAAERPCYKDKP